jgi:hypothetical protein
VHQHERDAPLSFDSCRGHEKSQTAGGTKNHRLPGARSSVSFRGGTEPWGTEPWGTEPWGTEPWGTEPWGTEPWGTEPWGTEPNKRGARSRGLSHLPLNACRTINQGGSGEGALIN